MRPYYLISPREPRFRRRGSGSPECLRYTSRPDQIIAKIEAAYPALEIVDTRYHDYVFKFEDNVADNSSSAGFILGEAFDPRLLADGGLAVSLTAPDGEIIEGHTSAAMGDPVAALAWLCRELNSAGIALPAGSIVLTGGLTKAPSLQKGRQIAATFAQMGQVSFLWK